MLKRLSIFVACFMCAARAFALDLGLSPNESYALWVNINNALVGIAQVINDDKTFVQSIEKINIKSIENAHTSATSNVIFLKQLKKQIDLLRQYRVVPQSMIKFEENHSQAPYSALFLNSGILLDGLVEWLVLNAPNDVLASAYYRNTIYVRKTDNDVQAQMLTAQKRLQLILEKIEPKPMQDS